MPVTRGTQRLEGTGGMTLYVGRRELPTGEQECDEAGFFGHVQLEAGAAEDVFDDRL